MGLTVFQALDNAVEAGGTDLGGKDIVGGGKGATGLLDEMCLLGMLEKTAAKTPKYTVTAKGRATWERDASDDRRHGIERREQDRQRQVLTEFLTVVEKKQGKALTKAELPRFSASVRQEACDRMLVEPGTKDGCYRLLPAGEAMLLAGQPLGLQLERLSQLHREVTARWRAAHLSLGQVLDGSGVRSLQAVAEQLAERGAVAVQTFDDALAGLVGLTGVADAVLQVHAEVEAAARVAHQAVEAERGRLAEVEGRLRAEVERQRQELESFERRIEDSLKDATSRPAVAPCPDRNGPPPAAVWEATRAAHERLRQENIRTGGIVKVPELTDTVLKAFTGLSPAAIHEMLKGWQQEGRLTLQLCNDPRLEPRASEGVQSPRGLLFYVHMR